MKQSNYWKARSLIADRNMHRRLDSYDRTLARVFDQAKAKADERIYHYLERLAQGNGISIRRVKRRLNKQELAGYHMAFDEYLRLAQGVIDDPDVLRSLKNASEIRHISRWQAMRSEMDAIATQLWGEVEKNTTPILSLELEQEYRTMLTDLERIGQGMGFTGKISQRNVDRILRQPWGTHGSHFSSSIWSNRDKLSHNLQAELAKNAMGIQSLGQASENIAKTFDVSLRNAKTLVRTEAAAVRSQGKPEMYRQMGAKGFRIVATLDHRTSDICQGLDGTVIPIDDYETGVTAPPFHPRCRTTTVPDFSRDNGKDVQPGRRAARDPKTGKTYITEPGLTYPKWNEGLKADSLQSDSGTIPLVNFAAVKEELEKSTDPVSFAQSLLEMEKIPIEARSADMSSYGEVSIDMSGSVFKAWELRLKKGDFRDRAYQYKTAFHEFYHAKAHGLPHGLTHGANYANDFKNVYAKMDDTFAEVAAHYMNTQVGFMDELAPSYPGHLVENLPKLKQLPKFRNCSTIIDFGREAMSYRWGPEARVDWARLTKELQEITIDKAEYAKQYIGYIKDNDDRLIDLMLENLSPNSRKHRPSMEQDLIDGIRQIESDQYPAEGTNTRYVFERILISAMNQVGVK